MKKFALLSRFGFPIFFGLIVYLFYALCYPFHLHYQEQLQMFLFSKEYFIDFLTYPAGLSDYTSTFITQFYYIPSVGALFISALLLTTQLSLHAICKKIKYNTTFQGLTYIPAIALWGLLCDENYLLSCVISLLFNLITISIYIYLRNDKIRILSIPVITLLLYWISGGVSILFCITALFLEAIYFKKLNKLKFLIIAFVYLSSILSFPFIGKLFLQYPLSKLFIGIGFNRYPVLFPYPLVGIWAFTLLIILSWAYLPVYRKEKKSILISSITMLIITGIAYTIIQNVEDEKKEEIMAYDFYSRTEQWDKIIRMANKKDPDSPLSVACLNLALSQTGNMGDCMFRYYQNGPEGLLPTFQRDFTLPFISGEVYYHLGFLNTSMRYAFEAMEAIPDYKKSSRAIKRMAEVNLLNGEYSVAEKYIQLLRKTLFYRDWANETLKCINNHSLIEKNITWKLLRRYRITQDFLFSEQEKDQMLGLLYTHSMSNKMAFEYLMAYTLLTKDLPHFVQYFPLGKKLGYKTIPAHYQEALSFIWYSKQYDLNQMPWNIHSDVKKSMLKFVDSCNKTNSEELIAQQFAQTYWYYLQFRK